MNLENFEDKFLEYAIEKTKPYAELMAYYKCAMMEIETKFNVLNEEFSMQLDRQPISSIKSRLKNPMSIRNKLKKLGYPLTVACMEKHLNDIAGIRVICSFTQDVYSVAKALENQDDIKILQTKDYIANPKKNGYRSLHLIIEVPIYLQNEKRTMKVEIQFRTISMDAWATMEHQLKYKKDHVFTKKMADELKYCADLSADLDYRMNNIRSHLLDK